MGGIRVRRGVVRAGSLGTAAALAVHGLLRWKARSALLVLLIGLAVASYLVTSAFASGTSAVSVPRVTLGMERAILARLDRWAYIQVRFLDDPRLVEFPRSESRFRCLVTGEEGGELALLRANSDVDTVSVARLIILPRAVGLVLL